MNPTRLRAQHFRTYANLDVALPTGPVGVIGSNGSGKSTLVNAIDVCLFGPEGRSLEPYLAQSALPGDTMLLELELEHRSERYRVRRTFSQSGKNGKATLDFEQITERMAYVPAVRDGEPDEAPAIGWESLTRGTVADTQAEIERVLGLTRDTFRASAYLAQGHGADFCDAAPRDRKRILADALGLGFWDRCNELARADRRDAEKQRETLNGRVALLEDRLLGADALNGQAEALVARVEGGEALLDRLRRASDEAEREHQALAEKARGRDLAKAKRDGIAFKLTRVRESRRRELVAITKFGELHERLLAEAAEQQDAPAPTCRECGQPLADEAKARALQAIRLDALSADREAREHAQVELELANEESELQSQLEALDPPVPDTEAAEADRALAAKTLAKAAVEDARSAVEADRLALERVRTRLEAVEEARAEQAQAVDERDRLQRDLAELELLERAFGRDGVPTFVLENSAIPALEAHADELLLAFGTDYRVELRTQREKRDGGAAETLDVVLVTPAGGRAYETFSGGERTRLNLALRLALARFLAHRRDASCDLLAIDEPDGLDESGMAALVDVLRGLSADGSFERLLLVSHVPALRDAFDTTITVTKTGGRSEVLVA